MNTATLARALHEIETPLLAAVRGKPTQVRLVSDAEGNRLVFDPLKC